MQYLATLIMSGIYICNLPLTFAFVWRRHRYAVGASVFSARGAMARAEKRSGAPKAAPKKKYVWPAVSVAARSLRHVRMTHFSARLLIGTGDAAGTAELCGAALALGNALRLRADGGRVDIRPDFSARTFEGEVRLAVTVGLGRLIGAALGYAADKWAL